MNSAITAPSVTVYSEGKDQLAKIVTASWEALLAVSAGANLFSLKHRKSGFELMRTPESLEQLKSRPAVWGTPVLFPPNRIEHAKYSWRGQDYSFPINKPDFGYHIHGIVISRAWTVSSVSTTSEETSVTLSLEHTKEDESFAGYPHEFKLNLTYTFTEEKVIQTMEVINLSQKDMPFGIGYHTAFNLPFGEKTDEAVAQCRMMATFADKYWELSDDRNLPTGKLLPWPNNENYNSPEGKVLGTTPVSRHCPMKAGTYEGKEFHGAVLYSPKDNARLVYEIDKKYPQCMIWNSDGDEGFFCVEPMSWMTDAPNMDLPDTVTGLQFLTPQGTWKAETSISLELN